MTGVFPPSCHHDDCDNRATTCRTAGNREWWSCDPHAAWAETCATLAREDRP